MFRFASCRACKRPPRPPPPPLSATHPISGPPNPPAAPPGASLPSPRASLRRSARTSPPTAMPPAPPAGCGGPARSLPAASLRLLPPARSWRYSSDSTPTSLAPESSPVPRHKQVSKDELPFLRPLHRRRKCHGLDPQLDAPQLPRDPRRDDSRLVRVLLISLLEEVSWPLGLRIVGPRNPVPHESLSPGDLLHSRTLSGLEERPETVVLLLADRVVLVVVAAGAVERQRRGTPWPCARRVSSSQTLRLNLYQLRAEEAGRPQRFGSSGASSSAASISRTIRS